MDSPGLLPETTTPTASFVQGGDSEQFQRLLERALP